MSMVLPTQRVRGRCLKYPMTDQTRIRLQEEGLRPPKRMTVAVTGACNLACAHCWVDAGTASSLKPVAGEALLRLMDEFEALGGEEICFTGGEPLKHPEWRSLMETARSKSFSAISLQTNGILVGDEEAAALAALDFPGFSIQVSLDGATEATHDLVRGKGAFSGALAGVGRLTARGLGPHITFFFTEMGHNLGEFPSLLERADAIGVGTVVAGGLVTCGRAAERPLIVPPQTEQYLQLLDRYRRESRFRGLYRKLGNMAAIEWLSEGDYPSDCCTFVDNVYITPAGTLYPCVLCHADEFAVSGVFGKTLAQAFTEGIPLWSRLLEISRARVDALGECRRCPGRAACRGGCMGRAWGSNGELLAPDDRCRLRRSVYELRGQAVSVSRLTAHYLKRR